MDFIRIAHLVPFPNRLCHGISQRIPVQQEVRDLVMTKSICVFCGARNGNKPVFNEAAEELGNIIAKNSWRLVYGAGDVGLMGAVARGVQNAGGSIFGVIPQHLMQIERSMQNRDHLIITDDMHSRKKLMYINSHAVVLLPGGAGSMDEFFEILTWAQLKLHDRPIIIGNIASYWQPMLDLIDHMINLGFADANMRDYFQVANNTDEIQNLLRSALKTAHV